ncbi:MAG: hypothetical protein GY951_10680 [Psychromonas sp.]|nr:hypothetical protein [Psychromonas sp.]
MASFSRAEYALKSAEYAIGNENKVDPAWDRYANEIHDDFINIKEKPIVDAASYLLNNPPRKQVLEGNKVKFVNQTVDHKQKSTQQILRMVRTVRNNLFHGGKYLLDGEQEPGRNQELVASSLTVLKACISLKVEVNASYEH